MIRPIHRLVRKGRSNKSSAPSGGKPSRKSSLLARAVGPAIDQLESRLLFSALQPGNFPSLGAFTPGPGTYSVDTDAVTLTGPGTSTTGVVSNGVAVFDFSSVNIPSGVEIDGAGSRPLALLSQSDLTLGGVINVSGVNSRDVNHTAIAGGAGGGAGGGQHAAGQGPGAGSGAPDSNQDNSSFGGAGGGGFGGAGAAGGASSGDLGGAAGSSYGNLLNTLQGGSGGGGGGIEAHSPSQWAGGGGGGGAVELGAAGSISIISQAAVEADGGSGATSSAGASGGGSGGGIFIHAPSVTLGGTLSATGGQGGAGEMFGDGGGGAGGRIVVLASNFSDSGTLDVDGGTSGTASTNGFKHGALSPQATGAAGAIAVPLTFSVPAGGQATDLSLKLDPTAADLEIYDNTAMQVVASLSVADVSNVVITGAANADNSLAIDYTNGFFSVPVNYDGGAGSGTHSLTLTGGTVTADTYTPGPAGGAGTIAVTAGATQNISFTDLTPVIDSLAGPLTVVGTSGNDAITYNAGVVDPTHDGLVTVDAFESIEFTNKSTLTLNTGTGKDTVSLINPSVPTGLTAITVNGGDPAAGDKLAFTVPGISIIAPTAAGSGTINNLLSAAPPVTFSGMGGIALTGAGSASSDGASFVGTTDSDTFQWDPGSSLGAGAVTGSSLGETSGNPFTFTPVSYVNLGDTVALGSGFGLGPAGGTDTVTIDGAATGNTTFNGPNAASIGSEDNFVLNTGSGNRTAFLFDSTAGTTSLILHGVGGTNTFNLNFNSSNGAPQVVITAQGAAGDVLNYTALTNSVTTTLDLDANKITSTDPGTNPVFFTGLTAINLDGGGGAVDITGTGGSNALTYTPTGGNAGTISNGADTVKLIDVASNQLLIDPGTSGVNTVTVNGTAAADSIDAVAGVTPSVEVGSLLSVNLVVADTAALDINGLNGADTLTVDSTSGAFAVPINYDGGTGSNALTLTGGTADSDIYTPGPASGAGQDDLLFAGVEELVSFTNLAPVTDSVAGPLAVNGTNGNDSIGYSDTFDPNFAAVIVNNLESIAFTNKTTLALNASFGDDTITINDGITPTGLTAISVDGAKGNNTLVVNALDNLVDVSTPGVVQVFSQVPIDYQNIQQIHVINALDKIDANSVVISGLENTPLTNVVVGSFTGGPAGATASTFTATVDWGDGTPVQPVTVVPVTGGYNLVGSHTYTEEGTYFPVVDVSDTGASAHVKIAGVPITIDYEDAASAEVNDESDIADVDVVASAVLSPVSTIVEGGTTPTLTLATFVDPAGAEPLSDYSAVVDWGDGNVTPETVSFVSGVFTVKGAHQYVEEGTYSPAITISHDTSNPQTVTDTNRVVVKDAPITGKATTSTTAEGVSTLFTVATFTDAYTGAPLSDFSATINWGDGHTDTGTISQTGPGQFKVTGTHAYAKFNTTGYAVKVAIADVGGSTTSATSTIKVTNQPISATPVPFTAFEGRSSTVTVANLVDKNVLASIGDYTVTIAWGDGKSSAGTVVSDGGGHFHITGSHAYAEENYKGYTVKVSIKESGGSTASTSNLNVVQDSPVDQPLGAAQATETTNVAFTNLTLGSFRDQDALNTDAGDYTTSINWGDSSAKSAAKVVFTSATANVASFWNVQGSHKYATAGTYTVQITVYDSGNPNKTAITITTTIKVVNPTPPVLPKISISGFSALEGNSGQKPFTFTVTLDKASTQTVTVKYATMDGTARVVDKDYVAASGTLTFKPGQLSQTITVFVIGATVKEPDETFFVNLSAAVNATVAVAQGKGVILNDD